MFGATIHKPTDEQEALDVVASAVRRRSTLRIEGGGTKLPAARPVKADSILSSASLVGVIMYEPSELVIQVRAGTPVDDVQALLREQGQDLPFEPPALTSLYGLAGRPTIGALAAMNLSGPRRIAAGAARDCLLGVRFINGRGDLVKSGGRVMKNVTGLDLVKLMAGSWGTLGFLTEVCFKVLPSGRTSASLCIEGLSDATAVEMLCAAMGSSHDVSGAAHLPERSAEEPAQTLIRIEGSDSSVAIRSARLSALLATYGRVLMLGHEQSTVVWSAIRELAPLRARTDEVIWRLSVPPDRAASVTRAIAAVHDSARWFYDWSGGLVWLAMPAEADAGARTIREIVAATRGHARLVKADDDMRRHISVFSDPPPAVMTITRRLKTAFDPLGILNPSRMYEGV
jgi:glycolate oxidase FAD binding subunit